MNKIISLLRNLFAFLFLFAIISVMGCAISTNGEEPTVTITGYPLGVDTAAHTQSRLGAIAIVLYVGDEFILAYHDKLKDNEVIVAVGAAVESEMLDGDDGQIELTGSFTDFGFKVKSLKANDLTLDL